MHYTAFAIVIASTVLYRALMLTIPFFHGSLVDHAFLNVLCGIGSDLAILGVFAFLYLGINQIKGRWAPLIGPLVLMAGVVFSYALTVHIRYVEHFGMSLRPVHFLALETGEAWWIGNKMLLSSWRAGVLVVGTVVGAWFLRRPLRSWGQKFADNSTKGRLLTLGMVLALTLIGNTTLNKIRWLQGVHPELRHHALTAVWFNYNESKELQNVAKPGVEQGRKLRQMLGTQRNWIDESPACPLWQKGFPSHAPIDHSNGQVQKGLTQFIQSGTGEKPWNVVLIIAESLRAHELKSFGVEDTSAPAVSPHIDKLVDEGISFQNMLAAGKSTHFGQMAIQCSMYGAEEFSVMKSLPMTSMVCLPDLFRARGYRNHFFYAADNRFDNQETFYFAHGVEHVHGEEEMDPQGARADWGFSDHELFNYSLEQLKETEPPFFATVLTLTNHEPWKLPEDAPAELSQKEWNKYEKLVGYVDWTIGDFVKKIRQELPRTIVVLVADHSHPSGEKMGAGLPGQDVFRKLARVPLLILIPDLPKELRGIRLPQLVSQVDIAPTLVKLLGFDDITHQFMGVDLFERRSPVYTDWQNTLLEVSQTDNGYTIAEAPGHLENLIIAAGRFNLFAPESWTWTLK